MPTPPTLIAFAEKDTGTTTIPTGGTVVSASLTWQVGDILVLLATGSGAANGNTFAPSNTGSGLAWTQKQLHAASSDTEIGAWVATATANSSGTVTITMTTTANDAAQMGVYQFRAPSGSTIAVGNTAIVTGKTTTQHVVGLLMTRPNSAAVWVSSDWGAAAVETVTPTPTTHSNVSPGPSASPFSLVSTTNNTGYISELDDQVSTGTINYGTTGTTGGPFAIVAVEITVSGSPTPSPRRMPLSL
jgi:hypothetical protein